DISDGLSSDLIHICKQSKTGCTIYEDKIPLDFTVVNLANDFNLEPTVCALNGGEDYELLFTISLDDYNKIKDNKRVSVIGHITSSEGDYQIIDKNEAVHTLAPQGWDSISKQ